MRAMLEAIRRISVPLLLMLGITFWAASPSLAQDSNWHVTKASGDIWFTTSGAQPVALTNNAVLKAGDTVRTGPNGRAMLVRGAESILVSPNSVVGLPANQSGGMSTTIVQQAGTILLDVERRNVQHFEVATPYLAAVVKGTQFQVTVHSNGTLVDVRRGQVQVSEYRSGQFALVNPGQTARASAQGNSGLSLSGQGTLSPIQQGTPSAAAVSPIEIPSSGFTVPRVIQDQRAQLQEREAQQRADASPSASSSTSSSDQSSREQGGTASRFITWGKGVLGMNGGRSNRDDPTPFLALTALIGLSAAVGAAVFRRKPKDKNRDR